VRLRRGRTLSRRVGGQVAHCTPTATSLRVGGGAGHSEQTTALTELGHERIELPAKRKI
jgi:hypothetical protein